MNKLSQITIEKLCNLINEWQRRTGPELVTFFNIIGFNDSYGQGFPSRKTYTEDRLKHINGTPDMDKCIINIFLPINFIGKFDILDNGIKDFNQYLSFDGWNVVRSGKDIIFKRVEDDYFVKNEEAKKAAKSTNTEDDFFNVTYDEKKMRTGNNC